MDLIGKLSIILCFLILGLIIAVSGYYEIGAPQKVELTKNAYAETASNPQTPYVMQYTPLTIQTPVPTPTPLYYVKLKYPTEPCSQTIEIFNEGCMGRTKNDSFCEYWRHMECVNCAFIAC